MSSQALLASQLADFVAKRLFRDQASVDLGFELSGPMALEQAEDMLAWASIRIPGADGETLVRAWTPDLPGISYSVVEIVTDD
ncbi:MAG: hypothetical protein K0U31_05715, partial [Actinomycetia bacterium]|nr:hypothetical protein [Actinomycetes bacterium]